MKKLWNSYCYAIILVAFSFATVCIISVQLDEPDKEYIHITVNTNDSLWEIAEQYQEEHQLSTSAFIAWVQSENGLSGDKIYPGDVIAIPVKVEEMRTTELASSN